MPEQHQQGGFLKYEWPGGSTGSTRTIGRLGTWQGKSSKWVWGRKRCWLQVQLGAKITQLYMTLNIVFLEQPELLEPPLSLSKSISYAFEKTVLYLLLKVLEILHEKYTY